MLLRKPKYLQCPAIFTISNLKKFLLHKFGINSNKFCVEIMYKVKSIALPDHYTLMDVAYIFTWKRVSQTILFIFNKNENFDRFNIGFVSFIGCTNEILLLCSGSTFTSSKY